MRINGDKLRLVRLAMRCRQNDMARLLDIPQPHLSAMENHARPVPESLVATLSFLSGFPADYLAEPLKAELPSSSALWYRKARDKYRKSEEGQAYCQLVFDAFEPLTGSLRRRPVAVTPVKGCSPQEAADHVRHALRIRRSVPIDNLTHLAELAGVRVIGIGSPTLPRIDAGSDLGSAEEDEFAAFSFWTRDDLPVVFIRSDIAPDLYNWALGHELIHLVMHSGYIGNIRDAEREGQEGTSELLLPRDAMVDSFAVGTSVRQLCGIAQRWNVSLKAAVLRAAELEIMSEGNKRYYLGADRSGAGAGVRVGMQKPRFYRQMCEVLFGTPVRVSDVARRTRSSRALVRAVLSAHSGAPRNLDSEATADVDGREGEDLASR